MVDKVVIDWGETDKAPGDRKRWMGSWVVARDGEEGDYFYDGPGGHVATYEVPSQVIGICLRWWPSENEGIGQTQVGAMANLVEPYFFPAEASGTVSVSALTLLH